MAGHHGCGGKAISHARGQLIHPVAACGVTQEVHAVGVDSFGGNERFDHAVEQIIDVTLVPKVPRIGRRARRDVDAFVEGVQLDLVAPLLVVDACWRAATAVHRDPQTLLSFGGIAKITTQVFEGVFARGECFFFQFGGTFPGQCVFALSHHLLGEPIGLIFGETHFIPHEIHQKFAGRGSSARRGSGVLPFPHRDGQQGFRVDFEAGHVVHVRSTRAGALGAVVLKIIVHGDGKRYAFAICRLANPNRNEGSAFGCFFLRGCITRGDIFSANRSAFGVPRHGEVAIDGLPTGGPHPKHRITGDGLAG